VSARLLSLDLPVFPEQKTFRLADATGSPDGQAGPMPPMGSLICASREQMWVGSLQEHVGVHVTLEEWDGAPAPCGGDWEDEAKAVLYVRGSVTLGAGQTGPAAVGKLRLAGGVGDYVVRVYARNRREVVKLYRELYERGLDPLSDEFQAARHGLEGQERYLLQLWRES